MKLQLLNLQLQLIELRQKDKPQEADFINCIAFGKVGEIIAQYLTKGRQIAITGNIRTGSYETKDGNRRYTTEVIVETFEFISSSASTSNRVDKDLRRKTTLKISIISEIMRGYDAY